MGLLLKDFIVIFLCILGFAFIVFLIAFLILEFLMREKEVDRYADEKSIKDLVKKFHNKLYEVSNQRTDEILECLKEMEDLDSVYYVMVDNNYNTHQKNRKYYFSISFNIFFSLSESLINSKESGTRIGTILSRLSLTISINSSPFL